METFVLILHLMVAVSLVVLVLLQQGKGADMGASFGTGASGSLFGAAGSANFLSHTTAVLAAIFFVTSLVLTWFSGKQGTSAGVMQAHPVQQVIPAVKVPVPVGTGAAGNKAFSGNDRSKAGNIPE